MILVDALYINKEGGKVLLDYLMEELNKTDLQITYLLDERIKNSYILPKKNDRLIIMPASFLKRRTFYKENKNGFSSILCFGNLPPNIKTSATVFTYFHQLLFLTLTDNIKGIRRLLYYLKMNILRSLANNTDYWLVQTALTGDRLSAKYKQDKSKIMVLPFYPPMGKEVIEKKARKKHSFVYVSSGEKHKNQINLITAFCNFFLRHKIGNLMLTISEEYVEERQLINDAIKQGIPILNLGFVERNRLKEIYSETEYLIFPSLMESFGLGIVEAIGEGCKVIGADLPYMHAVCKPSLTFDPTNIAEIENSFSRAVFEETRISESLVENKINSLINLLK